MQTSCCYCHKPFNVTPEHAGKVVSCPHCFGQLQLPPLVSRQSPDGPITPMFAPRVQKNEADEHIWIKTFRVVGILSGALGVLCAIIGVSFSNDVGVRQSCWILFCVGLIGFFQSLFIAFLVEVFLDIRALLKTLVDRTER